MPSAGDQDKISTLGLLCGVGAGALWGLVFLGPELARPFTPLQLMIGRCLAYGAIAALLIGPRWGELLGRLTRRTWFSLTLLALCGNTLYYVLLSTAVQTGGIALTSLVIGFLPVAVSVLGSRERGAMPLAKLAPSLLLCVAGAVCIGWQALTPAGHGPASARLIGLACAIGALASWTIFAVLNSRWLARMRMVTAQDWNLLTGLVAGAQALLLLPAALLLDRGHHDVLTWAQFASISLGLAVFASIIGNALWNRMSRLLPLTLVGQMILFETLFALIYGFVWEQRLPTALEAIAFALVAASVISCVFVHRGHAPRDRASSNSLQQQAA